MIQTPIHTARPETFTDREELRAGLEATRASFHHIVNSIPRDRWHRKSPATAWTVAEVFVHLTWALEFLPREVTSARVSSSSSKTRPYHLRVKPSQVWL